MRTGRAGDARPGRLNVSDRGKSEWFSFFSFDLADFLFRPGRSCRQCASAKWRCAMTEQDSWKIRVTKRKSRDEVGMEDGRLERRRRSEKGKEKERSEFGLEEKEWREKVERRLEAMEREIWEGFGRILEELGRLQRSWEESESEEGNGEEDGEKDEEVRVVEEMVDGEAGKAHCLVNIFLRTRGYQKILVLRART